MIRAYDIDLFNHCQPAGDLLGYVRRTRVATNPDAVRKAVAEYIARHDLEPAVKRLLETIMEDPALLNKTRIVTEGHWRNCVLLITPSGAIPTVGAVTMLNGKCDMTATLNYWRRHAEEIFLQLAAGQRRGRTPLAESLEQLVNWVFKRHFKGVLAAENTQG